MDEEALLLEEVVGDEVHSPILLAFHLERELLERIA